ncbi:uncharacterized protein [Euphorbia lathyris]|uniref:uncharacterized protein n=1 Tax=Euphorbia lathyris TaxID=212925 RepID=UPI003313B1F6
MVPIREFKRRKKAEKKVDQNVLTAALSSLQPQPNQPLDWWDDFSTRITGPFSNSKKSKTFESVFKITRKTFDYICSLVNDTLRARQSNLTGSNGKPLSPADQVAIALRRLSSGDSFSNVGDLFGINQSTVSHITWRFVEAMEERGLHHLCWPSTEAEMEDIKHMFEKKHGLPNCCGVIDTTHIVMTLSTVDDSNDAWIDQEKNHSMAFQAIVGPDMRFRDVSIGYPGSLSDALVLQYSDFFKLSEERKRLNGKKIEVKKGTELREYIIGDEGFPLLPWLLTPFQPALHDYQVEFNKRHSATLTVAQIALAKLKEIWRIIHGTMFMPDKNKLPRIVLVCCLLHNIVIKMEDKVLDETCISHAHDKDYQQQTCESASQTGTDLREEVSLGLSGELMKKNKNPQSRAQYKVQPVPPLTSQLLLPEGVHPQHKDLSIEVVQADVDARRSYQPAILTAEKVKRRKQMDSPASSLPPFIPGEKKQNDGKTLLELADELVTSCATGLSTAVQLQDKIKNLDGYAEKYFALKAEMVNKALTWKAKEESLVRAQQKLLDEKRSFQHIIHTKDEKIQELTKMCNLQESQTRDAKKKLGDKFEDILYQKRSCIQVKGEKIQEVNQMCNLQESQSQIRDAEKKLLDKFEEVLYQKRLCIKVKDEKMQELTQMCNLKEFQIRDGEKELKDKLEELLDKKIWVQDVIQTKDKKIEELTRLCNLQESQIRDAEKKLGELGQQQNELAGKVKEEKDLGLRRLERYQIVMIKEMINQFPDVDVEAWKNVYPPEDNEEISDLEVSDEEHAVEEVVNESENMVEGTEKP